jgi:transcription antitermination factor NusG
MEREQHPWYGVRVRSNFEQMVSAALRAKGYEEFLPLIKVRRRWSDRTRCMDQPLFPGYVFCRFDALRRVPVLEAPGVVGLIAFGKQLASIPEKEIAAVKAMLLSSLSVRPHPFLESGQKIRVVRGPLAGVEGVVVEIKKEFRLVASVTLLQRSVSVEIDHGWVSTAA